MEAVVSLEIVASPRSGPGESRLKEFRLGKPRPAKPELWEPKYGKPMIAELNILIGFLPFAIIQQFFIIAPLGAESLSGLLRIAKPCKKLL